jgi:hypothetical protein
MSPTAPALPAGTTLGHSFEYGVDVNLGTTLAPAWQPVRRISDVQDTPSQKTQPAQTYDDFGADNNDVVGSNTNLAFAVQMNRSQTTGEYLPEVEALLARTRPTAKGGLAVIEARWYHKPETGTPNPTDAGQGFFTVAAQRANTGADGAVEVRNFTLTGKGEAWEIANPFTGWGATAPTIAAVTPPDAGDGDLIEITGTGFVDATALSVDGAAAEFVVMSGATIVAVLPVGDAGDVPVVVTNPAGASAPFTYTRGA